MRENVASIRIMKKLGLEFDCEFENEGVRLVRYAMSRLQFFSRVNSLTRLRQLTD